MKKWAIDLSTMMAWTGLTEDAHHGSLLHSGYTYPPTMGRNNGFKRNRRAELKLSRKRSAKQ